MGQITEDFIQRAMRCCQLGQHPSMTVWETRQLLTAWVEWQGCRDERDKLNEANRICEQWRQWTVAARAENNALRARVEAAESKAAEFVQIAHDEAVSAQKLADRVAEAEALLGALRKPPCVDDPVEWVGVPNDWWGRYEAWTGPSAGGGHE